MPTIFIWGEIKDFCLIGKERPAPQAIQRPRFIVRFEQDNYGTILGIKCRHEKYLEDTSTQMDGDEISRSLKMFAMLTAYTAEPSQSNNQFDAIRQEFACNGYSCDDHNKFQYCSNELSSFSSDYNVRRSLLKMPQSHATEYNRKLHPKRYNNGIKSEKYSPQTHCVFCDNNKQPYDVVKSHAVRDALGKVLCPKLRTYVCPICGASGDDAHTVKYCPNKPIVTMEDAIKAESSFRLTKNTYYKQQMKI